MIRTPPSTPEPVEYRPSRLGRRTWGRREAKGRPRCRRWGRALVPRASTPSRASPASLMPESLVGRAAPWGSGAECLPHRRWPRPGKQTPAWPAHRTCPWDRGDRPHRPSLRARRSPLHWARRVCHSRCRTSMRGRSHGHRRRSGSARAQGSGEYGEYMAMERAAGEGREKGGRRAEAGRKQGTSGDDQAQPGTARVADGAGVLHVAHSFSHPTA